MMCTRYRKHGILFSSSIVIFSFFEGHMFGMICVSFSAPASLSGVL